MLKFFPYLFSILDYLTSVPKKRITKGVACLIFNAAYLQSLQIYAVSRMSF